MKVERKVKESAEKSSGSVERVKKEEKKEIKISRENLLKALNLASPALSSTDFVPILSHYCFEKGKVTAYNDIQAITVSYQGNIVGGVPGSTLTRVLNSYTKEHIYINQVSSRMLTVKSGRSNMEIATLPKESFLFSMKNLDLEDTVEIDLDDSYIEGLERCLVSVGKDPTHPHHSGVTISYDEDGIVLYSTDNTSLGRYKVTGKAEEKGSAILPEMFCQTLLSFLRLEKNKDDVEKILKIGKGFAYASIADKYEIFTKLVYEKDPLDFEGTVEMNLEKLVMKYEQPIAEDLQPVLERSLIFLSKSTDKAMDCVIEGNTLHTTTKSAEGYIEDVVEFEGPIASERIEFKIDPINISRVLPYCNRIVFENKDKDKQTVCVMRRLDKPEGKEKKQKGTLVESFLHLISYYVDPKKEKAEEEKAKKTSKKPKKVEEDEDEDD